MDLKRRINPQLLTILRDRGIRAPHIRFQFFQFFGESLEVDRFFLFKGVDIAGDVEVVVIFGDLGERRYVAVLVFVAA